MTEFKYAICSLHEEGPGRAVCIMKVFQSADELGYELVEVIQGYSTDEAHYFPLALFKKRIKPLPSFKGDIPGSRESLMDTSDLETRIKNI